MPSLLKSFLAPGWSGGPSEGELHESLGRQQAVLDQRQASLERKVNFAEFKKCFNFYRKSYLKKVAH